MSTTLDVSYSSSVGAPSVLSLSNAFSMPGFEVLSILSLSSLSYVLRWHQAILRSTLLRRNSGSRRTGQPLLRPGLVHFRPGHSLLRLDFRLLHALLYSLLRCSIITGPKEKTEPCRSLFLSNLLRNYN
jgi:hypothetical protein